YQRVTLNRALRTTRADALASARQIREPVHTSLEIWNAFDAITYRKGGGILAMFEKFLGDETFQAGVRHHMTQFAHSVADAEDFMASLSAGSQRPEIIPAFRSFIEQPGVPHLDVNVSCSADKAQLEVSQRRYAPLGSKIDVDMKWGVPFCFAVFDRAGQREEKCQIVDQAKMVLPLERCPSAVLPNAGGTGYYHFTLNEGGFDKLLARFSKLQPTEQLSTLQSMEAAFRAGRLSVDAFLTGVQRAVRSKAWDVQIAPLEPLALLIELHDGNEALVQKIARLYRPVVQRIGIRARRGEPDAYKLARPDLIRFFALAVADRRTRRALLPIAERELAGKLRQGETAVAKTALAVAVADKGKAFVDRVVAKLVTERDGFARSKLVAALAHAPAAEQSRIFGLVVDTRLRVNESIGLVRSLFSVSKHRRATLDWMDKNYDALAARLPSQFQGRILESTANLCDEASLATVESIGQRAAHRQGTVRTVAQVREAIGLCVALKNAVAGSAATAGR
ncbi:MAG: ERAP1-like C-terminal domain-containing protein, partial [Myxococcota bacterium]